MRQLGGLAIAAVTLACAFDSGGQGSHGGSIGQSETSSSTTTSGSSATGDVDGGEQGSTTEPGTTTTETSAADTTATTGGNVTATGTTGGGPPTDYLPCPDLLCAGLGEVCVVDDYVMPTWSFCSEACVWDDMCVGVEGVIAQPACKNTGFLMACALVCTNAGDCPAGMTCIKAGETNACAWPS